MSIDPRLIKTMLQLQLSPLVDFTGNGGSGLSSVVNTEGGTLFDSLLQQLLGGTLNQPAAIRYDTAATSMSRSGLPIELVAMSGMNPSIAAVSSGFGATETAPEGRQASDFEPIVMQAAAKFGIAPSLINAVIHTESSFNPAAVSSAGAKGLMQLMDATARGLGVTDSFDPVQNIEGGARYLAHLMNKYDGNAKAALTAYNAGPGRVDRLGIHNDEDVASKLEQLPSETQRYIGKVEQAMQLYAP